MGYERKAIDDDENPQFDSFMPTLWFIIGVLIAALLLTL